jgi:predicted dehydrogenase
MITNQEQVGIGVIGCGGFGLFAVQQFTQLPGVSLVGVAGSYPEAARAATRRFGVPDVIEIEALLQMPDVDLVYIATPPFLHYPQAMQALQAGKHVLIEKPTALRPAEADEMLAVARERGLLLATDLMQRYNPLFDAIGELLKRKPLGDLLHAYFENYACDEGLPAEHWFWDRSKSGGIFVEHGVHFFDLFAGWLGPGKVEAAQVCVRPGTIIEDQVQCTVRYGDDVLVNYYHGFTQLGRMDRQELRLVFERGDVRLEEWIPVRATIHAVVDEADTRTLCELFPGARLDVTAWYSGKERACSGRHKSLDVYQMVEMRYGEGDVKMHRYGELLRCLLADQLAWTKDRRHVRKVTEQNGRDALAIAVEADILARTGDAKLVNS